MCCREAGAGGSRREPCWLLLPSLRMSKRDLPGQGTERIHVGKGICWEKHVCAWGAIPLPCVTCFFGGDE